MTDLARKQIVSHDHSFNNGDKIASTSFDPIPITSLTSGSATQGQVFVANGSGSVTWAPGINLIRQSHISSAGSDGSSLQIAVNAILVALETLGLLASS